MLELPTFIQIEPVGECNLRCKMCPVQFRGEGRPNGPPAFIAPDTFHRIVDQFPNLEELQLQGLGEPMMHPQFFAMVRYAADRGIRVSVNTNLTYITEKNALDCVRSGLQRIHISIDAATKATYERIRVNANYEKVIRNLHRLLDARHVARERALPTPSVELVAVAMRMNLDELPQLVQQAASWGVDAMSVQHSATTSAKHHYRRNTPRCAASSTSKP